jgi:excisionase family DNA binding protein
VARYTTVQAAKKLGIGRDTIYRLMKAKQIPSGEVTRIGTYRLRTWTDADLAEIRKFMKENPHGNRGRKEK